MKPLCFSTHLLIFFSFFIALLLNSVPLTPVLALFYPLWLPLVLIYWVMVLPEHVHLTLAWMLGLIVDVLHGNYLGEHSLLLCIIAFLAYRFHLRFRMFPLPQQVLFVLVLLSIYQGLFIWMQACLGLIVNLHWMWLPPLLISALLWPLLGEILKINALDRL
jgi:rod shape-determining protein MreD